MFVLLHRDQHCCVDSTSSSVEDRTSVTHNMSRILCVVFLSSVVVSGLCEGNGKTKRSLEAEIKTTKAYIVSANKAGEWLRREIEEESSHCLGLIEINTEFSNNSSADNRAQQKTIEELYKQLAKIYDEESRFKEVLSNVERLKLGIKVLEQDIAVLQGRRENSMAKSCFDLGDLWNVTVGKPGILSGTAGFDTIVLENELRLLQSDLADTERTNEELKMKLDSNKDLCDQKIANLHSIIHQLGEDNRKGLETIEKISKEIEEQKRRVEELAGSAEASAEELAKWKKAAKKAMDKYQQYALDVKCYDKLSNDLKDLVSPKD